MQNWNDDSRVATEILIDEECVIFSGDDGNLDGERLDGLEKRADELENRVGEIEEFADLNNGGISDMAAMFILLTAT